MSHKLWYTTLKISGQTIVHLDGPDSGQSYIWVGTKLSFRLTRLWNLFFLIYSPSIICFVRGLFNMFQCELWIKPYKSLQKLTNFYFWLSLILDNLLVLVCDRHRVRYRPWIPDSKIGQWNEKWLSEGWFWVVGSSWTHQDQKKWKFKARFLMNLNLVRLNNVTFDQDRKWLSHGISRESRVSREFFSTPGQNEILVIMGRSQRRAVGCFPLRIKHKNYWKRI